MEQKVSRKAARLAYAHIAACAIVGADTDPAKVATLEAWQAQTGMAGWQA